MRVDRMSSLDASFLHIEDSVSHMHIASVGIFSGPVPPFSELQTMIEGKLSPGSSLPVRGSQRAVRAGQTGVGR